MNTHPQEQIREFRTIRQMVQEKIYPGGEGGLRRLIEDGDRNGFASCVRRVNRRIFIDLRAYYLYLDTINGVA